MERKLKPVYDYLEKGMYRQAVQECSKVLKRQPGHQCTRVLKALAMFRQGKPDEAAELVDEVVAEEPTDDALLQTITIYFKESDELRRICSLYEAAVKQCGRSDELLSHLYMAYVRVDDYALQYRTAMQLYKVSPKNPYYFWAVMSLVLQGITGDPGSRALRLTLAERMVERFHTEGRLDTETEVLTYLYVLQLQGKHGAALALLDSPASARISGQPRHFLALRRCGCLLRLRRWREARDAAQALLQQERDNWQHYENFFTALIEQYNEAGEDINILTEGVAYLRGLLERTRQEGGRCRAPHLALLGLAEALVRRGRGAVLGALGVSCEEELLGFLREFGHKWCAVSDAKRFLPLLEGAALADRLRPLLRLAEDGTPQDVSSLYRHLTWLQTARCLTAPADTPAPHLAAAQRLLTLYARTHSLSGQTVPTDIRRNDLYALLAGHSALHAIRLLSHQQQQQQVTRLLLVLIAVLAAAVESSKANFQLRLLLIQLYNMIGCPSAARQCYTRLEVKSVQLDTLFFVSAMQALHCCHYGFANAILGQTNNFFAYADKETCEPKIDAYKLGSLSLLPELAAFSTRLRHSLSYATAFTEHLLLDLTFSVSSHKQALSQLEYVHLEPLQHIRQYDRLVDNNNLDIKIHWEAQQLPSGGVATEEDGDGRPAAPWQLHALRLRVALVGLLTAAADGGAGLQEAVAEMEAALATPAPPQPPASPVDEPWQHAAYAQGPYARCVLLHAKLLCALQDQQQGAAASAVEACSAATEEVLARGAAALGELQCGAASAGLAAAGLLRDLHHTQQTAGAVCLLLGFCSALLCPKKASKTKKKAANSQSDAARELAAYLGRLDKQLDGLHRALAAKMDACLKSSGHCAAFYTSLQPRFLPQDPAEAEEKLANSVSNCSEADATEDRQLEEEQKALLKGKSMNEVAPKEAEDGAVAKLNGEVAELSLGDAEPQALLQPASVDVLKACLDIDVSFEESLANLKTSIAAKRKYLASIR